MKDDSVQRSNVLHDQCMLLITEGPGIKFSNQTNIESIGLSGANKILGEAIIKFICNRDGLKVIEPNEMAALILGLTDYEKTIILNSVLPKI